MSSGDLLRGRRTPVPFVPDVENSATGGGGGSGVASVTTVRLEHRKPASAMPHGERGPTAATMTAPHVPSGWPSSSSTWGTGDAPGSPGRSPPRASPPGPIARPTATAPSLFSSDPAADAAGFAGLAAARLQSGAMDPVARLKAATTADLPPWPQQQAQAQARPRGPFGSIGARPTGAEYLSNTVYSSSADSSVATAEMTGSLTDDQADTVVGSPPLATEEWGSPHARPLPLQGGMFGAVGSGWSSPSSSLERSDGFEQRRNSNAARNRPPPLQSGELVGSTLDPSFGAKEPVPAIPVAGRRSPLALASRRPNELDTPLDSPQEMFRDVNSAINKACLAIRRAVQLRELSMNEATESDGPEARASGNGVGADFGADADGFYASVPSRGGIAQANYGLPMSLHQSMVARNLAAAAAAANGSGLCSHPPSTLGSFDDINAAPAFGSWPGQSGFANFRPGQPPLPPTAAAVLASHPDAATLTAAAAALQQLTQAGLSGHANALLSHFGNPAAGRTPAQAAAALTAAMAAANFGGQPLGGNGGGGGGGAQGFGGAQPVNASAAFDLASLDAYTMAAAITAAEMYFGPGPAPSALSNHVTSTRSETDELPPHPDLLNGQVEFYSVQFKRGRTAVYYVSDPAQMSFQPGHLVIVEADRGRDLGRVVAKGPELADRDAKPIVRAALANEVMLLGPKMEEERRALLLCQTKIRQKKLQMEVVDAEYQWDRRKLTYYFVADRRIDFRELVRELFKVYKTRIWMCAVEEQDGKRVVTAVNKS